ncbi:muts domain V-domain-containing protein, partial [Podospora didyma]
LPYSLLDEDEDDDNSDDQDGDPSRQSGAMAEPEPIDLFAEDEETVVCAVSESRVGEVIGLSIVNIAEGQADIVTILNEDKYRLFAETVRAMPVLPQIFLVLQKVYFPGIPIHPFKRKYWDEGEGKRMVERFAFPDEVKAIKASLERIFYATCAFSAAMSYAQYELSVSFGRNAMLTKCRQPADTMGIDLAAMISLELVHNIRGATSKVSTLFCVMNCTTTPQGRRLLRSTLLQPSTNSADITARWDAVERLSTDVELLSDVSEALKKINRIDIQRAVTWPREPLDNSVPMVQGHHQTIVPNNDELADAEKEMNQILLLKEYLDGVREVCHSLARAGYPGGLCRWDAEMCSREITKLIVQTIDEYIEPGAEHSNSPCGMRANGLWAVKATDPDKNLARRRTEYREELLSLTQYVKDLNVTLIRIGADLHLDTDRDRQYFLRIDYDDAKSKVRIHEEAGRRAVLSKFFTISTKEASGHTYRWRNEYIGSIKLSHMERQGKHLYCQTERLLQKSRQIQELADIVAVESDPCTAELKKHLLGHAGALVRIGEAIAMLDMLCSFASLAVAENFTRPQISNSLVLKDARHTMVELWREKFAPNDVYSSDLGGRFQVITGGNMSGKTTFIKSVAIIQIMAQMGCFVPVTYAAVPICDRVLARLSTDDKPEKNQGTFAVEMSEMNVILGQATENSLVIIDELRRSTTPNEGRAITLAMAEKLIDKRARMFFATHFIEIGRALNASRPRKVLNTHFESGKVMHSDNGGIPEINLSHKLEPGLVTNDDYGIELAKRYLPENVTKNAQLNLTKLRALRKPIKRARLSARVRRNRMVQALPAFLKQATEGDMTDEALASYVVMLQDEIRPEMD